MLSVLSGHQRYSHVTASRCDDVNPGLLGMNKVISEDALRCALSAIPEAEGVAWLDRHLSEGVACSTPPGIGACVKSSIPPT